MPQRHPQRHRTLWISDVHLGSPGCQAKRLSDFLQRHDCQQLYLVGDIFDGWKLKARFFWTPDHSRVIRAIIAKARRNTRVYYLSGNHDEFMRQFVATQLPFGKVRLAHEVVHTTADGRRLLVLHGDTFDDVITRLPRLARLGDQAYEVLMTAEALINRSRAGFGRPALHFSARTKATVKGVVQLLSGVDSKMQGRCERRGLQGVVCGHTHHAEIRSLGEGLTYYNCGDWVDSCTALAEDFDGNISLLRYEHQPEAIAEEAPLQQAAA